MSAAIARLLTQFDAGGRAVPVEKPKQPPAVAKPTEVKREPPPPPKAVMPPAPDLLDEAYRRGHAAGLAEADAKLAEERVRSAIRLGEERAKWSDQQSVAIVNGFAAACRDLEVNIASAVARVLHPFLAEAIREKAVAALVEQVGALTSGASTTVFRVSGPSDLVEMVKAQLDTRRMAIEYQISDSLDIRAVVDQTAIETQIAAWTQRLKQTLR